MIIIYSINNIIIDIHKSLYKFHNLIFILNMDETKSNPHIPRANHHEMEYMENIVFYNSYTTKPRNRRSNKRNTSSPSYRNFYDGALGT